MPLRCLPSPAIAVQSLLALLLGAALTTAHGADRLHDAHQLNGTGVFPTPIVESAWGPGVRTAHSEPRPDDPALVAPRPPGLAASFRATPVVTVAATAASLRCPGLPGIRAPPSRIHTT